MITRTVRPAGALVGAAIAVPFALAFVLLNGAALPAWGPAASVGLAIVGVLATVVLVVSRRRRLLHAPERDGERGAFGPRYWLIVLGEVVLLFGGFQVLRLLGHDEDGVAWVAAVVGLHFIPLGALWRQRILIWTGAALLALGICGLVLSMLGAEHWVISAVSGVGAGIVLFGSGLRGLATA